MEINTNTLGPIEIDESRIITFVKPLSGVEMGGSRYALLDLNPQSPVKLLQSVEDAHICFLVGDPAILAPGYVVDTAPGDLTNLALAEESEAAVLVLLTVLGDANGMTTANLKAPIIVNRFTLKAEQLILNGDKYPLRKPVVLQKG